ncbi:addiction module protein [Phyllobacterium zundukense]|jgi:hypothetical protein|uniref:addiction module protein n=1 Tax=Phyllobacterium zundukense TaxID=1867719 RepID=UPI003965CB17
MQVCDDSQSFETIEENWLREISRRLAEIEKNPAVGIPVEEVLCGVRCATAT